VWLTVLDYGKYIAVADRFQHKAKWQDREDLNHTIILSLAQAQLRLDNDSAEYLTVVYTNQTGIHVSTCVEWETLKLNKDQTKLIREQNRPSNSYIIHNVEMLPGFGNGMDCSWAGALIVALKSMGENATYEKVMGVSGACWRIAFLSPNWDYSSVDALVVYDYAKPGYRAFGYTPVFADRVDKENRATERQNIINSIKNKHPVLGINLRVAHEWGVIFGYKDNGNELLCRTYFDSEVINHPDFNNRPGKAEEYLPVDNWPFIITHFNQKGNVPTDEENLINSLRVFIESMNMDDARGYSVGYSAYKTWPTDLRDDEWYKKAGIARRLAMSILMPGVIYLLKIRGQYWARLGF